MNAAGHPWIVVLMGPTAAGKTALGVRLAQLLNGEIISVDSSLVYRGMDIGTAKPSAEERAGIRHHLIDILDPVEVFSTGQFRMRALKLMAEIAGRGRLPLLVGGTMLYFNTLLRGLSDLPAADADIRRDIDREAGRFGWGRLHRELAQVDPTAAARIHPNDPQRIQRALEVYRLTGTPLTEHCRRTAPEPLPFRTVKLVLSPSDRAGLHERIERRFKAMLQQGLIEEVETLFERADLDETLPSIRAVGYRQVWHYLKGECDRVAMTERGIIATRQFAKRQMTWLRRETDALWLRTDDEHLLERAASGIDRFIAAG